MVTVRRLADRWTSARSALLFAVVVTTTFASTYAAAVRVKPLFAPDSTYYAAMSLWFGGASKQEAARQVTEMRRQSGWSTPPIVVERMFGWGLVQPRVVLPALSAPFVKIWGIDGLAVVPGLALAILVGLLSWVLARRFGWMAALVTVVLVMCSWRIMFYGSAMLTESLSALWGALLLVAAWQYQRRGGWGPVWWMVALTVISGFTRQATLIPAGAFVTAWLMAVVLRRRSKGWGVPALAVTATSVAVQLLQNRLFPTFSQFDQVNQFEANTGADSLFGALTGAPGLAWRIVTTDLHTIAGSDPPLFVLIALSGLSMIISWRRAESHLLLGAIMGTALYNVATGSATAFRYAMPGLVFFAVSVALLISRADPRPDQVAEGEGGAPARREEADREGTEPAGEVDGPLHQPIRVTSLSGSVTTSPSSQPVRPSSYGGMVARAPSGPGASLGGAGGIAPSSRPTTSVT